MWKPWIEYFRFFLEIICPKLDEIEAFFDEIVMWVSVRMW